MDEQIERAFKRLQDNNVQEGEAHDVITYLASTGSLTKDEIVNNLTETFMGGVDTVSHLSLAAGKPKVMSAQPLWPAYHLFHSFLSFSLFRTEVVDAISGPRIFCVLWCCVGTTMSNHTWNSDFGFVLSNFFYNFLSFGIFPPVSFVDI